MVKTSIWRKSRKFKQCNPLERLLYLYLITNEDTQLCGAYETTLDEIALHTGLDHRILPKIFEHLSQVKLAAYKDGWVMIANYYAIGSNPKVQKGIDEGYKCLPAWVKKTMNSLSEPIDSPSHSDSNSDSNSDIPYGTGTQPVATKSRAVARAVPARKRDELEESIDERFREIFAYSDFARERKHIKLIAAKVRRVDGDPLEAFEAMLTAFLWLRENAGSFWAGQPVIPSALNSMWDRVTNEMEQRHKVLAPNAAALRFLEDTP